MILYMSQSALVIIHISRLQRFLDSSNAEITISMWLLLLQLLFWSIFFKTQGDLADQEDQVVREDQVDQVGQAAGYENQVDQVD